VSLRNTKPEVTQLGSFSLQNSVRMCFLVMKVKPSSGLTYLPYQKNKAVDRQGHVGALLTIASLQPSTTSHLAHKGGCLSPCFELQPVLDQSSAVQPETLCWGASWHP